MEARSFYKTPSCFNFLTYWCMFVSLFCLCGGLLLGGVSLVLDGYMYVGISFLGSCGLVAFGFLVVAYKYVRGARVEPPPLLLDSVDEFDSGV